MQRLSITFAALLLAAPVWAQGWGNVAKKEEEKGFSWTDPLWPEFWMAWTPATFLLFCGIFSAMAIITVLEIRRPGGDERRGVLGLTTTRGDQPLWWPLAISVGWAVFCFRKV
jgi:predicted small integral membrane protein